jgi:tetratricopeptide (TPR) repeat protein
MVKQLIRLFWKTGIWARVAGAGLAILFAGLTPVPERLVEHVREARAAYQSDRYQEASAAYREAYAYQPWSTQLLAELVRASVLEGDHEGAIRYLELLASKRPLQPEEISLLGTALVGQGQVDEAIALWESARDEGTVEADTLAQLGDIYVSRKQWAQASEVLATVARFAPSDAALLYRLGLIQALDEPDWAAVTLSQAATLTPDKAEDLGPLSATLDRWPDDPPDLFYTRLGIGYLGLGELSLAEEAFSRSAAYNPAYGEALAYLGYVRARAGEPAMGTIQEAMALAPDSPTVLTLAGLTYKQLGRLYDARATFEQAYELDPNNPVLAVEIASTHRADHGYQWAELWMQEAVRLAPNDPRFKLLLAQFYVDEEYLVADEGLPLAQEAAASLPNSAAAHDTLGWAYFLLGDLDNAYAELTLAIRLNPALARAHVHLGALLEAQGETNDALIHYQEALALDEGGVSGNLADRAIDRLLSR